ncbi:MAG: hypothetical protein VCD66_05835, partial [Alphaproteobacteria bacterium]
WNCDGFSGVSFNHSVLAGRVAPVSKAVKAAAALRAGPKAALTAFETGAKWSARVEWRRVAERYDSQFGIFPLDKP